MVGRTYLLRGEPVTVAHAYVLPSRARPLPDRRLRTPPATVEEN